MIGFEVQKEAELKASFFVGNFAERKWL